MSIESSVPTSQSISCFAQELRQALPDPRDRRGKRLDLPFIVVSVVLGLLCGRRTVSSLQRFMQNQLTWLRQVTLQGTAKAPSRAHLPRLLAALDWTALNELITRRFALAQSAAAPLGWVAIDGKALRGSGHGASLQSIVLAVEHTTGIEVACARQCGEKVSEIVVVRELLEASKLAQRKVTFDALHTNPQTLEQVHQAGGTYIAQVKENQPEMLACCRERLVTEPCLADCGLVEKSHGRVVTRKVKLLSLPGTMLDKRWAGTGLKYLVAVTRQTFNPRTQTSATEQSCYVTNFSSSGARAAQLNELEKAIRAHWTVESNNWVRDVTLGEDRVKSKSANQSQVMARLRSCALGILRKLSDGNLQALVDKFNDCPASLATALNLVKFL